jgi:hypothetical protein
MCPKWLARIYLRLRGRKPDFINHINYTTPHGIIRELSKHNVFIEDLGLKNYLNSIKGNGWLRCMVKPLLAKFKLYGSIELVATKLWISNEKPEETRNAETNL